MLRIFSKITIGCATLSCLALMIMGCKGQAASMFRKAEPPSSKGVTMVSQNPLYELLVKVPWVNLAKTPKATDLEGRVILLDFWTFCCINCIHAIPDLHRLEEEFDEDLLVLGIHSAKFENEQDAYQINQSIEKYGIQHAVANDADFLIWRSLGVRAWPTFVLIGADGHFIEMVSGEGPYAKLHPAIKKAIADAKQKNILKKNTLEIIKVPTRPTQLKYPGKLLYDKAGKQFFVADSEHHQIRVFDLQGKELKTYGSGISGFKDGSSAEAQFKGPQGMALKGQTLYVTDTENHALRTIDLKTHTVKTLFGSGKQSSLNYFMQTYQNELNSPWDIVKQGDGFVIAMAGSHQLYHLDAAHKLSRFAGSGIENIDDGTLPKATLAQPSGVSLSPDGQLFFLDSETSSLRTVRENRVETLVGKGLFEFGLYDGDVETARLQHPLGLAATKDKVYIADTYNHAIRVYDRKTKQLSTLAGGKPGYKDGRFKEALFREPNDISVVGDHLWVADTNNHVIRKLDLTKETVSTIKLTLLPKAKPKTGKEAFLPNLEIEEKVQVGDALVLRWVLPEGTKLNAKAPSQLQLFQADGQLYKSIDLKNWNQDDVHFSSDDLKAVNRIDGTYYYCRVDGTGACVIASIRLHLQSGGKQTEFNWHPKAKP